jgi:protein-tyrosine phosphatase
MVASIYWLPNKWPGRLAIAPRPRGGEWLEDEMKSWKRGDVDIVVSLLTPDEIADFELQDEAAQAQTQGIQFHSYPVPDRGVPDSLGGIDELAKRLARDLQAGRNVVIHCRQGIGRSALLAAIVLGYLGVDEELAIKQISDARRLKVPETTEQCRWISDFAKSRRVALTIAENRDSNENVAV